MEGYMLSELQYIVFDGKADKFSPAFEFQFCHDMALDTFLLRPFSTL